MGDRGVAGCIWSVEIGLIRLTRVARTFALSDESKMSLGGTSWIIAKRVLWLALLGAVVGGIAGWVMYGGWGTIMAPTFALIGAIMGALNALLFSGFITLRDRTVNRPRLAVTPEDEINDSEWNDADNWTGALFYHSRVDRRIIVPKRVSGSGYTINLGRPIGLAIAIALVAILLGIAITSAISH
jgi:hypothetical protein